MIGFMAVLFIHEMYSNHKYEQSIEEKKYNFESSLRKNSWKQLLIWE
jgi:hypothetical protein